MTAPHASADLVLGNELELVIGAPANGGSNVARVSPESKVIFVEGGIEGERALVKITRAKDSEAFARGRVTRVLEASPNRRPHPWPLADPIHGRIGGAELGHVVPAEQRRMKAKAANDALVRIGRFDESELSAAGVLPESAQEVAIPSGSSGARTRVAFAVSPRGRLGMHPSGSRDVVEVEDMPLAVDLLRAPGLFRLDFTGLERVELTAGSDGVLVLLVPEAAHRPVRGSRGRQGRAPKAGVQPSRQMDDAGLRRCAERVATVLEDHIERTGARVRASGVSDPALEGVDGDAPRVDVAAWWPRRQELRPLVGEPLVAQFLRRPDGTARVYRVTGDGFWQIHEGAPDALASKVVELAEPRKGQRVADLYAGAGLFTGALLDAAPGLTIDSVEAYESASHDAAFNLRRDESASAITGRVEDVVVGRSYDTVVLDPSRQGAGEAGIAAIVSASPGRIVYVSCDAGSFARDARMLVDAGYSLVSRQLVDIYPDTHHVETIALFTRASRR